MEQPFAELPEALVEEMLSKSEMVGESLYVAFKEIQESKEKIGKQLQDENILIRYSDVGYP